MYAYALDFWYDEKYWSFIQPQIKFVGCAWAEISAKKSLLTFGNTLYAKKAKIRFFRVLGQKATIIGNVTLIQRNGHNYRKHTI